MLVNPIVSTWVIHTPVVYRFMDREYVDRFFNDGELQLASFSKFRQHPNEKMQDKMEGIYQVCGHGHNSNLIGVIETGWQAYILSGTVHNTKDIVERFGYNAAIQIFDTTNFGIAIGRQISGLLTGTESFCNYNNAPVEFLLPNSVTPEEIGMYLEKHSQNEQLDLSHFMAGADTPQRNAMFFKKNPRYQDEMEYRWVWITDHSVDKEVVIKCPSAKVYCKPFYC